MPPIHFMRHFHNPQKAGGTNRTACIAKWKNNILYLITNVKRSTLSDGEAIKV